MLFNIKLQTKLIISFSILVITIIVVLSLFLRYYIINIIEDRIIDNTQQLSIKITQQIDSYIKQIDQVSKNLITNKDLLEKISEINNPELQKDSVSQLYYGRNLDEISLNAIIPTSIPTSHIYIYSKDKTFKYSYNPLKSNNFDLISANGDFLNRLTDRQLIIYANASNQTQNDNPSSLSLIRSIYDLYGNMYGYVEVQEDYNELMKICDIGNLDQVYILDKQENYVFPAKKAMDASIEFLLYEKADGKNGILKDKENILIINQVIPVLQYI